MCGITGFCSFSDSPHLNQALVMMSEVIKHRGPDDFGTEVLRTKEATVGFSHRRLSIIELSRLGHQPMWDKTKNLLIVYNGEIYNYKEIRRDLEQLGHSFISNSDTEVILNAFLQWGRDCVNQFIGMFAFVIYNKSENKIYLCRDRLGVKPLYYYRTGKGFLFASEIKSFHQHPDFVKELDLDAFSGYLRNGYITGVKSIFKNAYKVKPGNWLIYDIGTREFQSETYWDISDLSGKQTYTASKEDAHSELKSLLRSSFRYRLVSDVPVAVFLSGGVDSSLLASILAAESDSKITTITIGFNEKTHNEAPFAKQIAQILGTNHIEEYCTVDDAFKLFPLISEVYDEPFGDNSAIPTILLSQVASKHTKVVLSADGGDELFAGYPSYQLVNRYFKWILKMPYLGRKNLVYQIRKLIPNKHYSKYSSFLSVICDIASSQTLNELNHTLNNPFANNEIEQLVNFNFAAETSSDYLSGSDDFVYRLKNYDLGKYLVDDILVKVDRATMYSSIESREPFLDHRLVEFAANLPSPLHLNNFNQKILLKNVLSEYIPRRVFTRPKKGFEVPVKDWLKGNLKDYYDFYLSESQIGKSGLLNYKQVGLYKGLFDNDISVRGLNRKLWFLLVFQIWYDRWMN